MTVPSPLVPPQQRGPGHWSPVAREAARAAWWRALGAVLAVVATGAMRERAWAQGFAVALGNRAARTRLRYLDAWRQGCEAAAELRWQRPDPYSGRPFALPPVIALVPPGDQQAAEVALLAPEWPPLVLPRRVVITEGRHAAAPDPPRRPRADRRRAAPRHARQHRPGVVARWLRRGIPGFWLARGQDRTGPLRAAA